MENKIKAVVIGHAVGDALGVPVEFMSRKEIAKNPVVTMRGFGTYPYPAGTWSDDTSMSLAALDSLISGEVRWDEIMGNFLRWLKEGRYTPSGEAFDVGNTCLDAMIRYATQGTPAIASGGTEESSNGNGSLMRIHPFALMLYYQSGGHGDWESVIENASALTHAHRRSKLACKIYTAILFRLLESPQKDSVRDALAWADCQYRKSTEHAKYKRLFAADFHRLPMAEIKSTGYVVDTLEAAVWCLLTTATYRDCVLKAVNLGSDTDTVAAIAGGLAGALYGYDSIPVEWRNTLLGREYIEEMCERASESWK